MGISSLFFSRVISRLFYPIDFFLFLGVQLLQRVLQLLGWKILAWSQVPKNLVNWPLLLRTLVVSTSFLRMSRNFPENSMFILNSIFRFNGLFAPHWRSDARGTIVGLTQYTRREHICRATLEAVAFQVLELLKGKHFFSCRFYNPRANWGWALRSEFFREFGIRKRIANCGKWKMWQNCDRSFFFAKAASLGDFSRVNFRHLTWFIPVHFVFVLYRNGER